MRRATKPRPMVLMLLVVALVAAACTGGDGGVSTTTVPGSTTTTTVGENPCEGAESSDVFHLVDIDGDGSSETVYLRSSASADRLDLGLCVDGETHAELTIDGGTTLLGFADLDDDGRLEILLRSDGERGPLARAVVVALSGLTLTDLEAEKWITGGIPDGPFEAAGFECDDIDDDGDLELLVTSYRPADDLLNVDPEDQDQVNLGISLVHLDGTTVSEFGVDMFETDFQTAYERWLEPDRCAPGSTPRVEIVYGENGWGRVDFDPADFASDGDVVLTGIARGGTEDRYVVVGSEHPSFLLGEFFPVRPVIWSSADALSWHKSELGDPVGELRDVVARADGSGFVAVGATDSFTAAAWVSTDGRNWELIEVPSSRSGEGLLGPVMSQIVETPLGLVAVGTEDYAPDPGGHGVDIDATVWLSTDGRAWERVEHPAFGTPGYQPNAGDEFNGELVGVTYQPGVGIVVVGSASDPNDPTEDFPLHRPAAWISADGSQWQRYDMPGELRLRGVTASSGGLVAHGVSTLSGSPSADAVVLVSTNGQQWVPATGAFAGLGGVDGIQSINHALEIPGVRVVGFGSDEKEFETVGGAAVWWSNTADDPTAWHREAHDDRVFEELTASPTATMTDAVWSDDRLVVVGFSGRTVEFPGGGSGCCLIGPAVWVWPAVSGAGSGS
ncbi:MAG: hypothetical protein OER12_05185 [Acidimicrobiia bacterium]|nr:hypothetical protein [Acidimicrobiia bacterium]